MSRIGDLSNHRVASLYARVPPDRLEAFQAFRRDFPYKSNRHDGVEWLYLDGGSGEQPLLLLSGALAIPDISWVSVTGFAESYRVLVPAYPPVSTMYRLVDGIAAVLRREGVESTHVMGGSYGGFVAQVLARRFPDLTRSLVLSNTLPPNPEMGARLRTMARLLRWLPMGLLRALIRRTFSSMMPEWSEETALTLAIFDELVGVALGKEDVIGILERTVDYSAMAFTPQDLSAWPGKVLLLFGEQDPATPPEVRDRLEALYPGCQVHVFEGAGHGIAVTHKDEYQSVIEDFFSQE